MTFFTAIPLPDSVKKNIRDITAFKLPVPYVNTTNLHITLNFFGQLESARLKELEQELKELFNHKKSFLVVFSKLVKFNKQIHLTLEENPALKSLQKQLESELKKLGYEFQDRLYYPHVKLSNLHMDKVLHPERKLATFPNNLLSRLSFVAGQIVLYESKLMLHHPKYTVLKEYSLQ